MLDKNFGDGTKIRSGRDMALQKDTMAILGKEIHK